MSWERRIRFEDEAGETRFGEPDARHTDEVTALLSQGKFSAKVFTGEDPLDLQPTEH